MAKGMPVWLHICDASESCLRVSTDFALNLQGSVIEIPLHSVDDLVSAIYQASDELERDAFWLPNRAPGAFSEVK